MLEVIRPLIKHIPTTQALQELIYGLVMSLTTISAVSLTVGLESASRSTLILAALGVNLTWGLADMLVFVMIQSLDQSRHRRMVDAVFGYPEEEWALEAIRDDLDATIVSRLDPADRERIYFEVLESGSRSVAPHLTPNIKIMSGGLLSLLITVMASLSVVLPLLLVEPLELAFQVASGSVILLLFLTGFVWAPFAGVDRWRAGLGMMSIGIVIALCTLVFGG